MAHRFSLRKGAAIALVVLALSPAAALADAASTQPPIDGPVSITGSSVLVPGGFGPLIAQGKTEIDHLGLTTFDVEVEVRPVILPSGLLVFFGNGDFDFEAANGDHLTGTLTHETTAQLPGGSPHTFTEYFDIGGGSGRFADADGEITLFCRPDESTRVVVEGVMYVTSDCSYTGVISY
jgi:hypothetical protein